MSLHIRPSEYCLVCGQMLCKCLWNRNKRRVWAVVPRQSRDDSKQRQSRPGAENAGADSREAVRATRPALANNVPAACVSPGAPRSGHRTQGGGQATEGEHAEPPKEEPNFPNCQDLLPVCVGDWHLGIRHLPGPTHSPGIPGQSQLHLFRRLNSRSLP